MKRLLLLPFFYVFGETKTQMSTFPALGNVGIGTASPDEKLVMRYLKVLILVFCLASKASAQQTIQQMILLRSNLVNSTEILMYKEDNTNYYSLSSNNGGFGIYNTNASAFGFYLKSDGNVGIGTTDPKGYKLAVAGNMIAESVKVKVQGTWPDYVFAKDYKLPSLSETEIHIKEKGHLPGIPSAVEVKENGIELGEMNKKLLQKIEELTLHLIEQNKLISDLKQRVVSLEKR